MQLSSYKPQPAAVINGGSLEMQDCPFQVACALEKVGTGFDARPGFKSRWITDRLCDLRKITKSLGAGA